MNEGLTIFGYIVIEPKAKSRTGESFWADEKVTRDGFTAFCRKTFGEFADEETTAAVEGLRQRAEMLATLEGLRQVKKRKQIRHANVVGN